jgi:hypothetical protein
MAEKPNVKISLTPERQQQIQQATGKKVKKLKIELLESRLPPAIN